TAAALESAEVELERERSQAEIAARQKADAERHSARARDQAQKAQELEAAAAEDYQELLDEQQLTAVLADQLTAEQEQLASTEERQTALKAALQTTLKTLQEREADVAEAEEQALSPRSRYLKNARLAAAAVKAGKFAEARRCLAKCPGSLRNWDWDYLTGMT